MAEDDALGAERRFRLGTAQAGAEACGQRPAVDLDRAQPGEVEADQTRVPAAQRRDPADDAGAAAVGDDGDPLCGADVEHAPHGRRVAGKQDGVGRGVEAAAAQPRQVGVAAAGRVADPVLSPGEDVLRPDCLDQARRQRLGLRQLEALQLGGARPGLELADPLAQRVERLAVELRRDRGVAPAPPLRVAAGRVMGGMHQ